MAVTTGGAKVSRVKYGSASWVYGEELNQNTAIWWSTNSQKLAFYRFDESQVMTTTLLWARPTSRGR